MKDKIKKWIRTVRDDLQLDINSEYIETVFPLCEFIEIDEVGYSLVLCSKNIINEKVAMVVSFYIRPSFRNFPNFKKLLEKTEHFVRLSECKSLSFGCEIKYQDKRVYALLRRCGYTEIASVKKEF